LSDWNLDWNLDTHVQYLLGLQKCQNQAEIKEKFYP
jgi:hypothetical protein